MDAMPTLRSIAGVCDVSLHGEADRVPDLLLEVPHGATREADFDTLRAALVGSFPDALKDFFFVNTDVGAPELAVRIAERFVAVPGRAALVVRCLLPRTFVDCNRVIDVDAAPSRSAAGEVTPGLHAWVTNPADRRLLLERYAAYAGLVRDAFGMVCGRGGIGLMVHSYAPRSIDVPVDERIVERLHAEYRPENIERWPLRPDVDLIGDDQAGVQLAHAALVDALAARGQREGLRVGHCESYALHPSTFAFELATAHPGRTLCAEFRRDLLVAAFTPFAEMRADAAGIDRLAGLVAAGLDEVS
jgi:hypothetical protein